MEWKEAADLEGESVAVHDGLERVIRRARSSARTAVAALAAPCQTASSTSGRQWSAGRLAALEEEEDALEL